MDVTGAAMLAASVNIAVPIGTTVVAIIAAVAAAYYKTQQGRATYKAVETDSTTALTEAAMAAAKQATDLAAESLSSLHREMIQLREDFSHSQKKQQEDFNELAKRHHDCETKLADALVTLTRIEGRPTLSTEQVQALAIPLAEYVNALKAQNGENGK